MTDKAEEKLSVGVNVSQLIRRAGGSARRNTKKGMTTGNKTHRLQQQTGKGLRNVKNDGGNADSNKAGVGTRQKSRIAGQDVGGTKTRSSALDRSNGSQYRSKARTHSPQAARSGAKDFFSIEAGCEERGSRGGPA